MYLTLQKTRCDRLQAGARRGGRHHDGTKTSLPSPPLPFASRKARFSMLDAIASQSGRSSRTGRIQRQGSVAQRRHMSHKGPHVNATARLQRIRIELAVIR